MMTHDEAKAAWAKYPCVTNANGNVRTGPVRLSFPHLFERQEPMKGQREGKYGCALLFPIGVDVSKLKAAAGDALKAKWPGDSKPGKLKSPFLDAHDTQPDTEGYEKGMLLIRANSTQRPQVVNRKLQPITSPELVYAGAWVLATLRAFAYDVDLNKGISFGLQNIMLFADGEPFGGKASAQQDFEPLGDDDPFANGATAVDPFSSEADAFN